MKKEEREKRLDNHIKYWDLEGKIWDISIDALDDLSASDVISVLDRVKTNLLQQEAVVMVEEQIKACAEEESDEEEEEEAPKALQPDIKAATSLVTLTSIDNISDEMRLRLNN